MIIVREASDFQDINERKYKGIGNLVKPRKEHF
jgi:hypothetical protein